MAAKKCSKYPCNPRDPNNPRDATFECICGPLPSPFCGECLLSHMLTGEGHTPLPIKNRPIAPIQAQRNDMCDDCTTNAAVCFCVCLSRVKKRCQTCHVSHCQNSPDAAHFKHPMTVYQKAVSGTVPYETFKGKQDYIQLLLIRIGGEMAPLDAFMEKVEQEFDELLRLVETTKATFLLELRAQRGKLAAALSQINQMVEAKRYEEMFMVETILDDYILNGYKDSRHYQTEMFTGKIEMQPIKKLFGKTVTYSLKEKCLFYYKADIPIIKGNSLHLYNRHTYKLTQRTLNQTTNINRGTAYCYILDDIVLCCGGEAHNLVYEVNVQNGIVNQVASMSQNRRHAGIFNWNRKYVYIFGGKNPTCLRNVEKYDLEKKIWVTVPSMQREINSILSDIQLFCKLLYGYLILPGSLPRVANCCYMSI